MLWRTFAEQAAMATGNFAKLFGKLELPPMSPVAIQLLQLSQESDCEISKVADVIATDPGISTKILTTLNSSYFGLSNQVADVRHGILLMGIKRVTSLALAFSATHVLPKQIEGFDPQEFWQDSVRRAIFASAICSRLAGGSEGEAFTGGLLQNIALPLLLFQWAKYYLPIFKTAQESERELVDVEDERLSWNHAQAGAWMARNWSFPDVLVCSIGLHHTSIDELEQMNLSETPVAAVAASSCSSDAEDVCCNQLGISPDDYQQICSETEAGYNELAALFGAGPSNSATT